MEMKKAKRNIISMIGLKIQVNLWKDFKLDILWKDFYHLFDLFLNEIQWSAVPKKWENIFIILIQMKQTKPKQKNLTPTNSCQALNNFANLLWIVVTILTLINIRLPVIGYHIIYSAILVIKVCKKDNLYLNYLTRLTWLIHTSFLPSKWNLYLKIQFLA